MPSQKNVISESKFEEISKKSKVSGSNFENESLSSLDSIIENSDDDNNILTVKNKEIDKEFHKLTDISLKRPRSSGTVIHPEVKPIKIKKEMKKILILSNTVLTANQTLPLSKKKSS